jgi:osmotically-inducible protein OsmY
VPRSRSSSDSIVADLLAAAAGAALGVVLGYLAGGAVGRVNSRRIKAAVARWRERTPEPRVWTAEDAERLEAQVLDALNRDVVLARRPIRVRVLGMGLVELTGRVSHLSEVGLAGDTVQAVPGVRTVLNHLLVSGVDETVVSVPGPNAPRAARG